MRFSRFPRGWQPSPPSARRVAAARRAVQAEQDRYPLFPQLVTHHTPEARLAAIDKHRVEWWQEQRDFRATQWRRARASLRALPPGPSRLEFEQSGQDRATYGERLLSNLADDLKARGLKGLGISMLKNCRQFYRRYPGIRQSLAGELGTIPLRPEIGQSAIGEFDPGLPAEYIERLAIQRPVHGWPN